MQKYQTITECGSPCNRGGNPRRGVAVREEGQRVSQAVDGQSGGILEGGGRGGRGDKENA